MQYRADIQILRGIAVTYVVLFHFSFEPLKFGFIGVDVFFVISGFLMAILCQQRTFKEFYARRACRLLPAYFATILVVLVGANLLTLPLENNQVVEQALYAGAFASNIGFWMQNSYFSKSEFNPLLHLWSLGVEMQFYLITPLLYYLGCKFRWFLPLLLLSSLALCLAITAISPKTSFFLMPFRIWQFLIGWMVAWHLSNEGAINKRPWNTVMGYASLLVLASTLLFPIEPNKQDPVFGHPGLASLAACLAAGSILTCGLPRALVRSHLGRAFEILGKYSYSIYLVHFPVLVLGLYTPFSGTVLDAKGAASIALLVALIVLLSLALFHGIENNRRVLCSPNKCGAALVSIAFIATVSGPLNGVQFSEPQRRIFEAWTDRSTFRCGKLFRIFQPLSDVCEITPTAADDASPKLLLVGNSHADSIKDHFSYIALKHGYRTFFLVPNNPLLIPRYGPEWLVRLASTWDIKAVVFHFSRMEGYSRVLGSLPSMLADKNILSILLMPTPDYATSIPAALYKETHEGGALPEKMISGYYSDNIEIFTYAKSQKSDRFFYYDAGPVFCSPRCLLRDDKGHPLYFDGGHLTLTGARLLGPLLDRLIRDIGSPISHN